MNKTYVDVSGVERCTECLRPAQPVTPSEALYAAAKRAVTYLDATKLGRYSGGAQEDLLAARELKAALEAVEQERERLLVQG